MDEKFSLESFLSKMLGSEDANNLNEELTVLINKRFVSAPIV